MNGYAIVHGRCIICKEMVSFNPHKVPSVRIDGGERQPVCRTCIEAANPERVKRGLEPIEILPGAYDPLPEGEL